MTYHARINVYREITTTTTTDTDNLLNIMQQTCTKIMQWKLIQCNDSNTRLHKRTNEKKLQCKKTPIDK